MEEENTDLNRTADADRSSAKHKHAYSLNNPYTTEDEKVEIETWYQLPVDMSAIAFIACCLLWARGSIAGWQAYAIAFAVGVFTAVGIWIAYVKRIVFALKVLFGSPVVWVFMDLGVAACLAFTKQWTQAVFLAGNALLCRIPVGVGAIITNGILTSRYGMHPKYAFLKRVYGKAYPFDDGPD
jgi:hypothetical protein